MISIFVYNFRESRLLCLHKHGISIYNAKKGAFTYLCRHGLRTYHAERRPPGNPGIRPAGILATPDAA